MYGNISAFYGNISPFYGNISAFYGNISPFYGYIHPFYGNISPFYGNISPFYGNISPFTQQTDVAVTGLYNPNQVDPFWGGQTANPYLHSPSPNVNFSQVQPFWNTEASNWAIVQKAWGSAQTAADYQGVANLLQSTVLDPAGAFWGKAVSQPAPSVGPVLVAVPKPTLANGAPGVSAGSSLGSFGVNFSDKFLANAGVTFNSDGTINASSLANVSQTQQAVLFLNMYDNLMSYTGAGHVDWWMGATGWTPNLASIVGSVYKSDYPITIGMLDFSVSASGGSGQGSITQYGDNQGDNNGQGKGKGNGSTSTSALTQLGSTVYNDGHGAAVGSLIMGSIDGTGILGILPTADANVITYNPYDSTGTTNWTAVGAGIQALTANIFNARKTGAPVGVINASLGVAGWTLNPGWNDALSSGAAAGRVLVVAAGNDGMVQPADVAWNTAKNPTLLVVGSVGVTGAISNFSNTPGEACLVDTVSGACDKLKNHFLVAPGELILVSDGQGNISRQTGTSLAAPLVTGAVALLQARWPWLGYYPNETAQIILQSATPLGSRVTNPTVPDPVYGWGELNIAASQAPLNWNALTYTQVVNGKATPLSVGQVVSAVQTGTQASWNTSKLYFTALEQVGNTHRDFQIPMGASLVGQLVNTEAGQQQFQSYLSLGLRSWVAGGAHFADSDGDADANPVQRSMLGFAASSTAFGKVAGMDFRGRMTPAETPLGFKTNNLPMDTDFALYSSKQSLRFGYGQGAAVLGGQDGFAQRSDYDPVSGGANPLLGLASGGAFAEYKVAPLRQVSISFGVTQRRSVRDINVFGAAEQVTPAAVYGASAEHLGIDFAPTGSLVLHTAYTRLHEDTGLLGVQSLQSGALQNGSTTSGASVGFDYALARSWMLSASGTVARTDAGVGQSLQTGSGGLVSSSAEVALSKTSLFARSDRLRLTLSKPMQVVGGRLHYTDFGVVDRQTGALGFINETAGAAASHTPLAAELLYGRVMPDRRTEVSFVLRASSYTDQYATTSNSAEYMAGGKYRLTF